MATEPVATSDASLDVLPPGGGDPVRLDLYEANNEYVEISRANPGTGGANARLRAFRGWLEAQGMPAGMTLRAVSQVVDAVIERVDDLKKGGPG